MTRPLTRRPRAYRLLDEAGQLIAELMEANAVWYAYARWGETASYGPYPTEDAAADAIEGAWRARGCPRKVLELSAGGAR